VAEVEETDIRGVLRVRLQAHADERGRFVETFRQEWLPDGAPNMLQGNRSDSARAVLRGLHYHLHQADYWYVPMGRARVVLHDLREAQILLTGRRELIVTNLPGLMARHSRNGHQTLSELLRASIA
jgi:dTDP-4-dehydrorhamnose 3,5-epimerase-like enzyme